MIYDRLAAIFLFFGALFLTLNHKVRDVFFLLAVIAALPRVNWKTITTLCRHNRWVQVGLLFFGMIALGVTYGPAPFTRAIDILWKYRRLLYPLAILPLFHRFGGAQKAYQYGLYLSCGALFVVALYNTYFNGHLGDGCYSPCVNSIYTGLIVSLIATVTLARLASKDFSVCDLLTFGIATLYFLLICQSRTGTFGYLAACGTIGVLWLAKRGVRWQHWLIFLSAMGLVMVLFVRLSPPVRLRLEEAMNELRHYQTHDLVQNISMTSFGARLDFLHATYALALEKPWFGFGTGGLAAEFVARGYRSVDNQPTNLTHNVANPHNQYALTCVEHGFIGLLILVLWLLSYLRTAWPTLTQYYAAYGICACIAIACMADSVLMIGATADVIIFTLCYVMALKSPKRCVE